MAQKEIIFKVTADTGNASANVEKLNDALETSGKDVQEVFGALRQSIKDTEKAIDTATKKYGENAKEVDNLRKELGNLNNQYTQLTKSNTDLGASFDDVYGETMDINRAIGELEDRMYQLYIQGEQNTKEFEDLQKQVATYRQAVISVDKAVDQLAESGRGLGTALQLGETVVAGYGVAQGAMAILGTENEKLLEVMTRLQAVQAMLASIQQLRINLDKQSLVMVKAQAIATAVLTKAQIAYTVATTATTTATKALRLAMLALPIVAIIAGITALASIIKNLTESNETAKESYDNLTSSIERQTNALDRAYANAQRNASNQIALAKARGESIEEIHDLELKALADEEAYRRRQVINLQTSLHERKLIYQDAMREENYELAMQLDEQIKMERKKLQDLTDLTGQYQIDVQIKNLEFQNKLNEQNKAQREKDLANYKQNLADKQKAQEEADRLALERQQLMEDLFIQQIEDADLRRLAQLELNQERERQQMIEKFGKDTELLKELTARQEYETQALIAEIEQEARDRADELKAEQAEKEKQARLMDVENRRAELEAELIRMEEDFYAKLELEAELNEIYLEQSMMQEDLLEGEKLKIYAEYDAEKKRIAEERAKFELLKWKETTDKMQHYMQEGLNAISSITDVYFSMKSNKMKKGSKEEEELAKKQFKIQKGLMLAQAVIDGFRLSLHLYQCRQ